jgi:hypothetical protein
VGVGEGVGVGVGLGVGAGGGGGVTGAVLKVPVTLMFPFKVTVHDPVPVHAPLHPEKTYPVFGVAESVTTVPLTPVVVQVVPQAIELLLEEIVPLPTFVTLNVNSVGVGVGVGDGVGAGGGTIPA